jgi:small basic protein (TIGR04137 family)
MTIDSTLKVKRGGGKSRNVLKRHERLAKMQDDGKWTEGSSTILGMPKVRVLKLEMKKKKKAKTEGDAAATPAAGGKAAAGKAAPAAGKAAAPAAKAAAKPAAKK